MTAGASTPRLGAWCRWAGPSEGGKMDEARAAWDENVAEERAEAGHCEGIGRKPGKALSQWCQHEASDPYPHILD